MRWRTVLVDVPALLVDLWFRIYWFLLAGITMVTVTVVVLTVVLALFGVRWGW
jgi:hypothetical protein